MASMTRLRRRSLRWARYDQRIRRLSPHVPFPPGLIRCGKRLITEKRRRQLFTWHLPHQLPCYDCGLPDLHAGAGDGIGSCDCPGCEWCQARPGDCSCGDPGEDWPEDVYVPVETVDTGGLL